MQSTQNYRSFALQSLVSSKITQGLIVEHRSKESSFMKVSSGCAGRQSSSFDSSCRSAAFIGTPSHDCLSCRLRVLTIRGEEGCFIIKSLMTSDCPFHFAKYIKPRWLSSITRISNKLIQDSRAVGEILHRFFFFLFLKKWAPRSGNPPTGGGSPAEPATLSCPDSKNTEIFQQRLQVIITERYKSLSWFFYWIPKVQRRVDLPDVEICWNLCLEL